VKSWVLMVNSSWSTNENRQKVGVQQWVRKGSIVIATKVAHLSLVTHICHYG
jgi:hypothetical protein